MLRPTEGVPQPLGFPAEELVLGLPDTDPYGSAFLRAGEVPVAGRARASGARRREDVVTVGRVGWTSDVRGAGCFDEDGARWRTRPARVLVRLAGARTARVRDEDAAGRTLVRERVFAL